jgi:1L-myo-inositol 1-phosphate cytidylyltransferase / CDP-L-myo-inositol myo-inositolphosphotransferase
VTEEASQQIIDPRGLIGLPIVRPRVGVVLAAGRSQRLSEVTRDGSKALIRLGGMTLVERAVRGLLVGGLDEVLVVVGYHSGPVTAIVNSVAPGRVRTVFAEGWEAGNGASLAASEPFVADEDLFILVTADHVFGEGALDGLLAAGDPAVLVDEAPGPEAWGTGTRVRLVDGRALAFGKQLPDPSIDCGAFVLPRRIFEYQRIAAEAGDASLAGAVTALAAAEPLLAKLLPPGTWWHDVDMPADVPVARELLRRSLHKAGDGPASRFLNRPISTRLAMSVSPLRLSPDLVSFVALLLGMTAAVLVGFGYGIAGGIVVHLTSVIDGVDGELARLQLRARPAGALLDGVLDRLADAAILAGLGVWALAESSDQLALILAVCATAGALLSMASKDRIAALGLPSAPERALGFLLGGRDGRLLIIAVCAVVGQPVLALGAVVMTSFLSLGLRAFFVWKATRRSN